MLNYIPQCWASCDPSLTVVAHHTLTLTAGSEECDISFTWATHKPGCLHSVISSERKCSQERAGFRERHLLIPESFLTRETARGHSCLLSVHQQQPLGRLARKPGCHVCLPRTMLGAVDLGYGDARGGQPHVLMSLILQRLASTFRRLWSLSQSGRVCN